MSRAESSAVLETSLHPGEVEQGLFGTRDPHPLETDQRMRVQAERLHIACIVGARPNFVKMAPLVAEMDRRKISRTLIHTGQHYSPALSEEIFRDLEIPEPDINLGTGGCSQIEQTAEVMKRLEPVFAQLRPNLVLVVGDVNSTLAASLVAVKMGIPLAHVEAGLRSFDRSMPEEINRLVTDSLADYLFTTESGAQENLLREGVPREKIHFVGNVMIDTLLRFVGKSASLRVPVQLGLAAGEYALVTLHRPSNVDDPERLRSLLAVLERLAERIPVIFPVHPRTRATLNHSGLSLKRVRLMDPLSYLGFLDLMRNARVVLTDSGGIQEETTILQVPCLTLRENTERPVTLTCGSNRLVGVQPDAIFAAALEALNTKPEPIAPPPLWDGHASDRILDILVRVLRPARGVSA